MGALASLNPAVRGLLRNPIVIGIVAVYGLLQLPQMVFQPTPPQTTAVVAGALSLLTLALLPFYQGGIIAMGYDALTGKARVGAFLQAGKSNYLPLLLALLVILGVGFVLSIVFFLLALVIFGLALGGPADASGSGGLTFPVLGVAVVGLLILLYIATLAVIQFYAHAIVLDDSGLIEGVKQSVSLVRHNLVSALGYFAILLGVTGLLTVVSSLITANLPAMDLASGGLSAISPTTLVLAAVGYVLVTAISGTFYALYSVAFYRDIHPDHATTQADSMA